MHCKKSSVPLLLVALASCSQLRTFYDGPALRDTLAAERGWRECGRLVGGCETGTWLRYRMDGRRIILSRVMRFVDGSEDGIQIDCEGGSWFISAIENGAVEGFWVRVGESGVDMLGHVDAAAGLERKVDFVRGRIVQVVRGHVTKESDLPSGATVESLVWCPGSLCR